MKLGRAPKRFARRNPHKQGRFTACFSRDDHNGVSALPLAVMRDRLILLLTVFLSSLVAAAQTPTPQIVPGRQRLPIMTKVRTVPVSLATGPLVLSNDSRKSAGRFSYLFVRTYEHDQDLENLSRIHRVETLFLRQSSLPLFQLWGGRLLVDGFTRTLHMQNVPLGPPAVGGLQNLFAPRQSYPAGPRFYGLSLRFPFARDAQTGRPAETWRCFARLVSVPR